MRVHRTLIVSIVLALVLAVPAGALAKRLIIGGSTSVLPLAQKLATAYHQAYPRIPAPKVGGGQSDIGISGAADFRCRYSGVGLVVGGREFLGEREDRSGPSDDQPAGHCPGGDRENKYKCCDEDRGAFRAHVIAPLGSGDVSQLGRRRRHGNNSSSGRSMR